jgi:arginine utilization regulatory protein
LNLNDALEKLETEFIQKALEKARGNISMAARILGIPRQTLQYKLRNKDIGSI